MMHKFVFWTGVYNILLGLGFFIPAVPQLLGINSPASNFWLWLPATLVIYLGILLILCSNNLQARGSLVYWEGIFRIFAFLILAYFGFFSDVGFAAGLIGIIDLLIGLGYIIGLPKILNTSHSNLLRDSVG